jgi:hypothetical protein
LADETVLASMTGPAAGLLVLTLYVGGALATGTALGRLADAGLSKVERLTNALLLGAGALGVAHFVVGLVRLDRLTITFLLACSYTPLASRRVRSWLADALRSVRRGFTAPMFGHLAVLGLLLLVGLPRPTGDIRDDVISYHLLGPSVWLRTGRIVPVLDSPLTAFPALIESLFAGGMALSNDRFPALLGVVFAAVFLGQVYGFVRLLGGTKTKAILMSFLSACAPAVMGSAPSAFVDVAYASFSLAAVRLLLASEISTAHAVIGGTLLGFALGIKYTAIPLVGITLLVLPLSQAQKLSPRVLFGRACLILAVATAVGAPFYVKNAVALGSPIYPPPLLLAHLFHARAFPLEASASLQHRLVQTYSGYGRGLLDLLLLPWRYSLFTQRFAGGGGIGAAPLALAPIGALVACRRRPMMVILAWVGIVTLVWFVTLQQSRFLLHVVGLSFACAAIGAMWLERNWPRAGRAGVALVAVISTLYGLGALVSEHRARLGAALSSVKERELRERNVPYLEAWEYLNHTPGVGRVLVLEQTVPTYYLEKNYLKIQLSVRGDSVHGIESAGDVLAHVDRIDVTHVLDVDPPDWSLRTGFEIGSNPKLRLVFESDHARVYEVLRGKPATLQGGTAP